MAALRKALEASASIPLVAASVRKAVRAHGWKPGEVSDDPGDALSWYESFDEGMCWEGLFQEDLPGVLVNAILRDLGYDAVLCHEATEGIEHDIHDRLVERMGKHAGLTETADRYAYWERSHQRSRILWPAHPPGRDARGGEGTRIRPRRSLPARRSSGLHRRCPSPGTQGTGRMSGDGTGGMQCARSWVLNQVGCSARHRSRDMAAGAGMGTQGGTA